MKLPIKELNFDTVVKIIKHCNKKLPNGGAAFFVIREICERIYQEYDRQGISIELHTQLNKLVSPLTTALRQPKDIAVLDDLVKRYARIKF